MRLGWMRKLGGGRRITGHGVLKYYRHGFGIACIGITASQLGTFTKAAGNAMPLLPWSSLTRVGGLRRQRWRRRPEASLGGSCTLPKVAGAESILARHGDQRVMHGHDSSPFAAQGIYYIYIVLHPWEMAVTNTFSHFPQSARCKNDIFPTPFVQPCRLKPFHSVHPKPAAWLVNLAPQRTSRGSLFWFQRDPLLSCQDLLITCSAGWKCRARHWAMATTLHAPNPSHSSSQHKSRATPMIFARSHQFISAEIYIRAEFSPTGSKRREP